MRCFGARCVRVPAASKRTPLEMGLVEVNGVPVEEYVAAELATEFKGAGIVSRGTSVAVAIVSLGLETGDELVTVVTSGDAGGRCSDCARCEASSPPRWLGGWVLSWEGD